MRAIWQGEAIAQSDRVETVGGYTYFPRACVRMDLLRVSPKTASDRQCPHGVQFYDLVNGAAVSKRAAWSYEAPAGGPAVGRSLDRLLEGCQGDVVPTPPCAGTPCGHLRQVGCGSGGAVRQSPATVQTTAAYLPMQKRLNT